MTDPFQLTVAWALSIVSIGGGIAIGVVAGRRRGLAIGTAAATTWFVGMGTVGTGSAHLAGVLWNALRGSYFYNFRLAALLLVGFWLILGGALCIAALSGLRRGSPPDWSRGIWGSLLLLLVAVPLVPVQPSLGGGTSALAALNLVVILAMRRVSRSHAVKVGTPIRT